MPRIPLVEYENASAEVRALYDSYPGRDMPLLNVTKLFGNHPGLLAGLTQMARTLYFSPKLSPRYRELAYLRASQANACHY
jgi:alkylhydroperoxidase family enzyme